MIKYIVLECMDCMSKVMYPSQSADGYKCNQCSKGLLIPVDNGTRLGMEEKHNIKMSDKTRPAHKEVTIATRVDVADLERIVIGARMYDALTWEHNGGKANVHSILQSNEDKEILIRESDLMKLIQLATPLQKVRRIKLI